MKPLLVPSGASNDERAAFDSTGTATPQFLEMPAWLDNDRLRDLHHRRQELLSQGQSVIDLSMINPDLPPPRLLLDRLMEATGKPLAHRYSVSRGIRKLREAFAAKYQQGFGVSLDVESEICVTLGSKDALQQALRVIGRPGEKVLMGAPTYPAHLFAVHLSEKVPAFFELGADETTTLSRFEEALERERPRIALFNFPNNPTGATVSRDFWKRALDAAARYGTFVLNDFVYGELCYEANAVSVLAAAADRSGVAESYSLSKAYNVPGWRIGALVGSSELVKRVSQLKARSDYGLFLPLQVAGAAALASSQDLAQPSRRAYATRAKLLVSALRAAGFTVALAPQGGASVWAKLPDALASLDGRSFASAFLDEERVVCMPGDLFGPEYSRYVRFALVGNDEQLREVAQRLHHFLEHHAA